MIALGVEGVLNQNSMLKAEPLTPIAELRVKLPPSLKSTAGLGSPFLVVGFSNAPVSFRVKLPL